MFGTMMQCVGELSFSRLLLLLLTLCWITTLLHFHTNTLAQCLMPSSTQKQCWTIHTAKALQIQQNTHFLLEQLQLNSRTPGLGEQKCWPIKVKRIKSNTFSMLLMVVVISKQGNTNGVEMGFRHISNGGYSSESSWIESSLIWRGGIIADPVARSKPRPPIRVN